MDEELASFPYIAEEGNGIFPARSESDLFQSPVREEETAKKLHCVKSASSLFPLEVLPHHSYVSRAQRTVSTYHKYCRNSSHPQEVDVVRRRGILESIQPPQKPLVSISESAMEKLRDRVSEQYKILLKPQFYLASSKSVLFVRSRHFSLCSLRSRKGKARCSQESHIARMFAEVLWRDPLSNFIYDPATHSKKRAKQTCAPSFL